MNLKLSLITLAFLLGCSTPNSTVSKENDGSSCDRAIIVSTEQDEFDWLMKHLPGVPPGIQTQTTCKGIPVDIMEVQLPNGAIRTLYFNVSKLRGK